MYLSNFVEGVEDGEAIEITRKGIISIGRYAKGKRIGDWKRTDCYGGTTTNTHTPYRQTKSSLPSNFRAKKFTNPEFQKGQDQVDFCM
jgi:hypothetical protein